MFSATCHVHAGAVVSHVQLHVRSVSACTVQFHVLEELLVSF